MKRQRESRNELVDELTGALQRADTMLTVTTLAVDNPHSELFPATLCSMLITVQDEIDTAKAISARL